MVDPKLYFFDELIRWQLFLLIAIEGCFRFIVKVDPLLSMLYLL